MYQGNKITQKRNSENFPVASWLVPKKYRSTILNIYNFARYGDDIVDSETLSKQQKEAKIIELKTAIEQQNKALLPIDLQPIIDDIKSLRFNAQHLVFLLDAFAQDIIKSRYENFEETLNYCQKSAATIGRLFLETTGETNASYKAADKICITLQLINHLQDLKADYKKLNRIYFDRKYIPNEADLELFSESDDINNAKQKILGFLQQQLDQGREITNNINSLRVRVELNTIINVADKLIESLQSQDIITRRVELSKSQKISCLFKAISQSFKAKKQQFNGQQLARKSGSSFLEPMLSLSLHKQSAILNFYSFCKLVDDSADDPNSIYKPSFWQQEIEEIYSDSANVNYRHPITKKIAIIANNLNVEPLFFQEIIAGQKMDLAGEMFMPKFKTLELYCYRVASCVGIIAAEIFGYNSQNKDKVYEFAINLGKYFQLINILRDFEEDLNRKRVYLPIEILAKNNISEIDFLDKTIDLKNLENKLKPVFLEIINIAEDYLGNANKFLPDEEKQNMKTAFFMEKIYTKKLQKIKRKLGA